ncbi:MAG: hypothetical protein ACE5JH_12055 [Acidobacteriota bacterium]
MEWRPASLFFAAGGLALSTQVLLLRELMVALQGDETAVALGLFAWLGGIAAGAGVGRILTRRHPGRWAATGFALLAALCPAGVVASRLARWALSPPPGELLPLGHAVALAVLVLAPPGGLVGLTFTALAATAASAGWRPGRGIARLYVLESLGSLAGGLAVTFLVVPLLDPMRGALLSAGSWVLVGSAAARPRKPPGSGVAPASAVPGRAALRVAAAVLLVLGALPLARRVGEWTVRARFRGLAPGIPLLDWADTPYQHVAIAGGALRHLYAGGQYAGSFPDPSEHEALAHRLACLAPRPGRILLVGSGFAGTLRYLLDHPVERIDLLEIDRRAIDLVRAHLAPEDARALEDRRVRIVIDDPRRFLSRRAGGPPPAPVGRVGARRSAGPEDETGRTYGLILILEPPPVTLLLARMSSVEFYRLCAARLAPDGVLVVRLETTPNVLTGESAALGGALWGALREVFPVVRAGPGPEGLLLAGTDPDAVTLDPSVLAGRFAHRRIASRVFVPELFPILFPPERVAGREAALAAAAAVVPVSRDERPVSFLHALALRQRFAGSAAAPLLGRIARAPPLWLATAALLPSLLVLSRLALSARGRPDPRPRRRRPIALAAMHAVAVTGGCGMAWSLLILFSYQTRAGALYGQIGLLAALFMLGLAGGGMATARGAELPAERARGWLLAATAAALLFALSLPAALRRLGGPVPAVPGLTELLHGVLLAAAGVVTGALFPVAAGVLLAAPQTAGAPEALDHAAARRTAGGLEAADHGGAAVAALVGGVVFIPALGLAGSAWLLAALETAALLGVLLATTRSRGSPAGSYDSVPP